tara:strand:+ start:339 stop:1091 length:753 start_codon:yes stop_codon:yes gene_type:complete
MKNKNIIIVGGCGQLGANFVKYLAELNYKIIIADNDTLKGNKLVMFNKENIKFIKCNVNKDKEIDNLIKYSKKLLKSIDAVIYVAYPRSKGWGTHFESLKRKHLNEDLNNNIGSSIIFSQKIIKFFLKQKYGNLIHFSSIQGIAAPKFDHYEGTKMISPIEYAAIKSGIILITKYLAKLYRKKNIRVNCISPGGIFNNQNVKFLRKYKKTCGTKGMLDPKDLNSTVKYLLSDDSKFINGQNIVIDDSWSL